MSLLSLILGHPQHLNRPSESQKGLLFLKKMNARNDTKTLELAKSAKETLSIFCLWHLSRHG